MIYLVCQAPIQEESTSKAPPPPQALPSAPSVDPNSLEGRIKLAESAWTITSVMSVLKSMGIADDLEADALKNQNMAMIVLKAQLGTFSLARGGPPIDGPGVWSSLQWVFLFRVLDKLSSIKTKSMGLVEVLCKEIERVEDEVKEAEKQQLETANETIQPGKHLFKGDQPATVIALVTQVAQPMNHVIKVKINDNEEDVLLHQLSLEANGASLSNIFPVGQGSGQQVLEVHTAFAGGDGQLTVKVGDHVIVADRHHTGWAWVALVDAHGNTKPGPDGNAIAGWVPHMNLREVSKVVEDYEPDASRDDQLPVQQGIFVEVHHFLL